MMSAYVIISYVYILLIAGKVGHDLMTMGKKVRPDERRYQDVI